MWRFPARDCSYDRPSTLHSNVSLIAGIATGSRGGLAGGVGIAEPAKETGRGFDAQLPVVKSAEPSGVGVSVLARPNGRTVRLAAVVWLILITSLSVSRNCSKPVAGMTMELRRPRTSSVIRKNVPCGFSFRSNVNCFRSTCRWAWRNCVSIVRHVDHPNDTGLFCQLHLILFTRPETTLNCRNSNRFLQWFWWMGLWPRDTNVESRPNSRITTPEPLPDAA